MRQLLYVFFCITCLMLNSANADALNDFNSNADDGLNSLSDPFAQEDSFLPLEQAFIFNFNQDKGQVHVEFEITKGYYLYKKQFKFKTEKASIALANLPKGELYNDEFFGETEIYKGKLSFTLPLNFALNGGLIHLGYQGCAEAGLCYPPSIHSISLSAFNTADASEGNTNFSLDANETSLSDALSSDNLALTLLLFFVLGVGLSLTPCVFPMYPILSSIIVGQGKLSHKQALMLSFVFVQGMAITYSLLGLVVASAGASLQVWLQSSEVLIGLSLLFLVLAASMFGLYELQLPSSWVNKLNNTSNQQKAGKLKGALVMGMLSGLIASPCTTAPLSGALLYVAQTGDSVLGFVSLYILSLGMGLPLLIIGSSAGSWLPKAGAWMDTIKTFFGFILLAVPLMLLSRFLDEQVILWLSFGLSSIAAIYFARQFILKQKSQQKDKVTLSILAICLAVTMATLYLSTSYKHLELPFTKIEKITVLEQQLAKAKQNNQAVMLDITADWCAGCKEFEHLTFANSEVQTALNDFVWLQLDVTAYTKEQDAFIQSLNIVGPPAPTVLIYDGQGHEFSEQRIRGFLPAEKFINHVKSLH